MKMLNRITMHHAGSTYKPSADALKAYHFLIDGDGRVIEGLHKPEANGVNQRLVTGKYAAHTWKLNSGNIGVGILAMGTALQTWDAPYDGPYPVRIQQLDAMFNLCAKLAIDYSIGVTREHLLSHAEVQPTLGVTQRNKWDFDYNPMDKTCARNPVLIGDEFRKEIKHRLIYLKPTHITKVPDIHMDMPTLVWGSTGSSVEQLQRLLGVQVVDGKYGPQTYAAVVKWQKQMQLRADGVVGPMTWASLQTLTK